MKTVVIVTNNDTVEVSKTHTSCIYAFQKKSTKEIFVLSKMKVDASVQKKKNSVYYGFVNISSVDAEYVFVRSAFQQAIKDAMMSNRLLEFETQSEFFSWAAKATTIVSSPSNYIQLF